MSFTNLVKRAINPALRWDGQPKSLEERFPAPVLEAAKKLVSGVFSAQSSLPSETSLQRGCERLEMGLRDKKTQKALRELIRVFRSDEGDTLLMNASWRRAEATFNLVFPLSDVAARNANGVDALTLAAREGSPEQVERLIRAGAPLDTVNGAREAPPAAPPTVNIFAKRKEPLPRCALSAAALSLCFDYRKEFLGAKWPRDWPKSENFWMIFDALQKNPEQARRVAPVALADIAGFFAYAQEKGKSPMEPRHFGKGDPFFQTQEGFEKLLAEFPVQEIASWMTPEQSRGLLMDKDPLAEEAAAKFRAKFVIDFEAREFAAVVENQKTEAMEAISSTAAGSPAKLASAAGGAKRAAKRL